MKRILLIGRGPLPSDSEPQLGFSQLRTQAFYLTLRDAGHAVRLLLLVPDAVENTPPQDWEGIVQVQEDGPGWIDHARSYQSGAEIIVSAGPYNPGRLAAAIAEEQPLWIDIPGDPLSELQALSAVAPTPLDASQVAAAHSGVLQVLTRADALSVISGPQRHATIGQLGLIGRLLEPDSTPPVHVLPITHSWDIPGAPPRSPAPGEPTVLALSGAFNPWFDEAALITALDIAFSKRSDLHVVCTGGGIPDFYEAAYTRFSTWAKNHPDRVQLLGWLPHEEMATALHQAHAGICLDRPGPEPELGSRTRLLLFAHMGLQCLSTAKCSLAINWAEAGALLALDNTDPRLIGEQLASFQVNPDMADRAQKLAQSDFNLDAVMPPLLAWVEHPVRTQTTATPSAVMAAELDANRNELARIYGSPSWQALNRIHALGTATIDRLKDRSK